jgi:hypothetical protein
MKKLYALCLITLATVATEVFLFHSPVGAQAQSALGKLTVHTVKPELMSGAKSENVVNTLDTKVLGFQCISQKPSGGPDGAGTAACFIVTGN